MISYPRQLQRVFDHHVIKKYEFKTNEGLTGTLKMCRLAGPLHVVVIDTPMLRGGAGDALRLTHSRKVLSMHFGESSAVKAFNDGVNTYESDRQTIIMATAARGRKPH